MEPQAVIAASLAFRGSRWFDAPTLVRPRVVAAAQVSLLSALSGGEGHDLQTQSASWSRRPGGHRSGWTLMARCGPAHRRASLGSGLQPLEPLARGPGSLRRTGLGGGGGAGLLTPQHAAVDLRGGLAAPGRARRPGAELGRVQSLPARALHRPGLRGGERGSGYSHRRRRAIVSLLPDARRPEHVARVTWEPGPVDRSLADVIGRRHVNRGPYDGRPVGVERLQRLRSAARPGVVRLVLVAAASPAGARFAAETREATQAINEDREMSEMSERWVRHGWRDIQTHRDGLALAALTMSHALRTISMMLPSIAPATFKRGWLRATEEGLATSPVYGLVVVRDLDDRVGQLEAGRLWQRLHLESTRLGLAAQPLNQWMERVDRERQLRGTRRPLAARPRSPDCRRALPPSPSASAFLSGSRCPAPDGRSRPWSGGFRRQIGGPRHRNQARERGRDFPILEPSVLRFVASPARRLGMSCNSRLHRMKKSGSDEGSQEFLDYGLNRPGLSGGSVS